MDSSISEISRRRFMVGVGGLTFGFAPLVSSSSPVSNLAAGDIVMNPWVTIAADGSVSIMSPSAEMGQGSLTALPLILADALDADWARVRVVPAPVVESLYGNPAFGGAMYTAGSTSVSAYYTTLRQFGAQVRQVMLDNVAKHWAVPAEDLFTESGTVRHVGSDRQLTYGEISRFAEIPKRAPGVTIGERNDRLRLIGKDVMRVDVPSKVNGTAKYSIDMRVTGMLYGAVVRGPVLGSTLNRFDDAGARSVPGFIRSFVLPSGVGLLCETPWALFKAKAAVETSAVWNRSGKAWGFDDEVGLAALVSDLGNADLPTTAWLNVGDAQRELSRAVTRVEGSYQCDYAYHAQMEPVSAIAAVSAAGDAAELWCGTQAPSLAIETVADELRIPRDRVTLHNMLIGGGFGRRGHRDEEFLLDAVQLSKEARRPVKVIWTREDDLHNGRFRPLSAHYLRAGVDNEKGLVAWHHRIAGDRVLPFVDSVRYVATKQRDVLLMLGIDTPGYDIPNQYCGQLYRDSGVRTSPLRGIGFTSNKFATESFVDEIATKLKIDPIAFRLRLLKNSPRGQRVLTRVAKMADWEQARDGRSLGAAYIEYTGTIVAGVAELSVDRDSGQISVHNFWCALDCGVQVQPDNIVAQTESSLIYGLGLALMERVSFKDGAVAQSNFYDYRVPRMTDLPDIHIELVPSDAPPTGVGQMATPVVAPAIANAVARLTGKRLRHTPMTLDRVKLALG